DSCLKPGHVAPSRQQVVQREARFLVAGQYPGVQVSCVTAFQQELGQDPWDCPVGSSEVDACRCLDAELLASVGEDGCQFRGQVVGQGPPGDGYRLVSCEH